MLCGDPRWERLLDEFGWTRKRGLMASGAPGASDLEIQRALRAALFAASRCDVVSIYGFPGPVHRLFDALSKLDHTPLCGAVKLRKKR